MLSRSTSLRIGALYALVVAGYFFVFMVNANAQDLEWIRQFGTNRRDEGTAVAKGPGAVYIVGNTIGIFPGETAALNDTEAFIRRYDEAGNAIWTDQFGSTAPAFDTATGAAADQSGVYVAGHTLGALPGQTAAGGGDAWIRKYDPDGNVLWTRQFGTTTTDEALAVATDGTAVYVVGHTSGDIVTGAQVTLNKEAFIRRYDTNGTVVWTRQFGTVDGEDATGVATDATGVYVAGNTGGNLGGQIGQADGYVRKYDAAGNVLWTRHVGTTTNDQLLAVAAGGLGVYVGGATVGTFAGQAKIGGLYDAYIAKLDTAGNLQWVRQFGSTSDDGTAALAVAASSVVVAGSAGESLVPGQTYTGAAFVQLLAFDGTVQSTLQFGNGSNDVSQGAAGDSTGVYVTGVKPGNALGQIPLGDFDAFALKITPPPPTSLPFSVTNLTGISATTDGTGGLAIGHGRIDTASGTTPSGVAIFGYRPQGTLLTEAGVPDSPLITSGRIYGEVSATDSVNTGLAIANPNNQLAAITFTLTDAAGAAVRGDSFTIGPNGQLARFLNEDPYLSSNSFQGTLSFSSTVPVGVIALRSLVNESGDFLITTLPVIDLSKGASSGTQVIPHFAVGAGWTTQIVLVNPTDNAQTGNIQFLGPGSGSTTPGAPVTVNVDGTAGTGAAYTVPSRSSARFTVTLTAPAPVTGSVRVVPANAGPAPTPLVVFSHKPGTVTLSEAGVPVTMGTSFRMYAESSLLPPIETGLAIANTTAAAVNVTLETLTINGTPVGSPSPQTLPASGQLVGFLTDFFPGLPKPFQGLVRVSTSATISVVALRTRTNERADFLITTTPPTVETGAPTPAVRSFPHFVNGEGWLTQFVLFSGTTNQTSSGAVQFFRQDGTPLPVNLR